MIPEEWRDNAACRKHPTSWWYPDGYAAADCRDAITICATCPVRDDCLTTAMRRVERHGIWGGLTPKQRDRIRHRFRTLTR